MWVPGAVRYYFVLLQKNFFFARRLELPGKSPFHEFNMRMKRISRVNEASKLKMFKRDLLASFASGVNAPLNMYDI